jgi:hypothetical protein
LRGIRERGTEQSGAAAGAIVVTARGVEQRCFVGAAMLSDVSNRKLWIKRLTIAFGAIVLSFVGFVALLHIDGQAYDRWRSASFLQNQHRSWSKDGAPWPPPNPTNYGWTSSGTSFVYTASHVIDGKIYYSLFAFRAYDSRHHYAITTNGVVLDLGDKKGVRLLQFTKGKAAAW